MHVVSVVFEAAEGQGEALRGALLRQAQNTLAAEGDCLIFDVAQDAAAPDRFFLYEIYRDAAAFTRHLESPHFIDFDAASGPLVRSKSVSQWSLLSRAGAKI